MKDQSCRLLAAILTVCWSLIAPTPSEGGSFSLMRTDEATVADIRAALAARQLTCRQLVQMYLDRIAAYDKKRPGTQRDNHDQSECPGDRRCARRQICAIRLCRPAALRAADRQGQFQYRRHADDGWVAVVEGVGSTQRGVPGAQAARRGGGGARQIEHGGVRLEPVRDRKLDITGIRPQPLCARPRPRRLQRRDRGGDRRQFRRGWARHRHRQFDPRTLLAHEPRRYPLDND